MADEIQNTDAPVEAPVSAPAAAPAGDLAPRDTRDSRGRRDDGDKRKFFKRKVCHFCKSKLDVVDYKDTKLLRRFMKEGGKILPHRLSGNCTKHQRLVSLAIKRARTMALLPYKARV
ncbi:MAG: 30S ribosomal protein S18 [Spirochaetes bacterium]|nr:30S ribosomal protein S18 [Spirochaetota bacterium]